MSVSSLAAQMREQAIMAAVAVGRVSLLALFPFGLVVDLPVLSTQVLCSDRALGWQLLLVLQLRGAVVVKPSHWMW